MTLWVVLTIMTSAAAVFLAVPLIRRLEGARADASGDVAVYRDQLQEVERERRDGLIDDTQAETARIEIKRRILAADRAVAAEAPALSGTERSAAVIGATAIVVLGSTILYAVTGSPDIAAVRSAPVAAAAPPLATGSGAGGGDGGAAMPPQHPRFDDAMASDRGGGEDAGAAGLPTVEEMTRRLAARLQRNPDDVEGWRTLGWSYVNIGRFDDAVAAYDKAIGRAPGNTELRDGRIEALLGGANGVVTTAVQAAIQDTLKRDPRDPRARYYAGLASAQDGDKSAALATWSGVVNDAGAGVHVEEQLLSEVRRRVSDLRRDMGLPQEALQDQALQDQTLQDQTLPKLGLLDSDAPGEAAAAAPETPHQVPRLSHPQAAPVPRGADRGPDEHDVAAAAAMPPADRMTMIKGMVEGLSDRLTHSPRDAEGWIKLIRSRMVLGEGDLAREALARGLAAFADDAGERDRITAAAQELGVR